MQSTKATLLFKANKLLLTSLFILFLIGLYPLYAFDKVPLLLMLNKWHHPILDDFFLYITWLGDGITYGLLLIILALRGYTIRKLLIGGISFCLMSVVVQSMKRIFFVDCLRPLALISPNLLHVPDGVICHKTLSFPSGHVGTTFTAICFLYLILPKKRKIYNSLLLIAALLIAYSRLYLCQHFYTDVYIGAWIGAITPLFVYRALINFNWKKRPWLDKSIKEIFSYTLSASSCGCVRLPHSRSSRTMCTLRSLIRGFLAKK